MRVQQEPGFVLHRRPYRESSWLVDVLARHYGRLTLLAKGARRTKSKLPGTLQPFQALLLSWAGRGNLPILTAAEAVSYSAPLTGAAVNCGFYMNELVMRLLPSHDAHPGLFDVYAHTFEQIHEKEAQELQLRRFEKTLLKELGYGLALDMAADTREPIDGASRYRYVPERGAFKVGPQEAGGLCVQGSTLLAIANEQWPSRQELVESKRLMRAVLGHFLGERPLHSRRIFIRQSVDKEIDQ
jgi:DNA repair protein RecO (recombination protein O)